MKNKGIILPLIVIVLVAIVILLMNICTVDGLFKIEGWIVFIGFLMWTASGMSFSFKDIASNWISALAGLALAYGVAIGSAGLTPALIVSLLIIVAMIFCMINHKLRFIFNNTLAVFMTIGTAAGMAAELILDPITQVASCIFGFIVLGLIPFIIVSIVKNNKKKAIESDSANVSA